MKTRLEESLKHSTRRHKNISKALRKQNICLKEYGFEYYDNLHQYSKNKIHCSCPSCSAKTNNKLNKSRGPVSKYSTRMGRIPCTNERYGKKNYKISDKKKIQRLNSLLNDYYEGEYDLNEAV